MPPHNLHFLTDRIALLQSAKHYRLPAILSTEEKTGMHGLPLRGAVIQKPVPKDTVSLEAELFSYSMKMEQKIEKLS